MAQSPDNRHQQLSLSGGYRIDAADTRISFNGAVGRLTQDDALLPYTSNNELTSALLPRRQLDGEIDKTNIALTLSASPLDKLRIDLRYRYDRSDNNTPVEEWNRVIADTFNSGEVEENLPYSFRRGKLSLGAAYRLSRTLRVAGGYDRTEHERDFQDVAEQTEDSSWGSVTWRPTAWLDLRAKGGAARRDVDRYDESVAESFGQNPLLGKYNLAYRYRRFAEVSVAASGIEKPVSLSVTSLYADDDYTKSPLGLLDGEDLRISGDLSYTLAENRHLYLQAGYEDIQSTQAGSERFSLPDWRADNSDSFRTVGAGLKLARLRNAVDVTMDYTRSAGNTEIALATAAGDADSLPDLASTLDSFRMRLSWRKTARMTLYLSARYERFVVDDWALQGVQADTVPVILTLGAEPYDYHRMLIGIGIRYRAGDPAPGAESP
jgi:MtrB/PioB family decaheme-associated outer membrane protein